MGVAVTTTMTEPTDQRQRTYRVWCPCDFEERFASKAAAKAILADHEEQCMKDPEMEVLV